MANVTIILLCVCGVVLVGCTRDLVTPVIERPARVATYPRYNLEALYVFGVEVGRRHLRDGRLREAEESFTHALTLRTSERPIFGIYAEGIVHDCGSGKVAAALDRIANFDIALRVDFGDEPCFVTSDRKTPNPRLPERVFEFMCEWPKLRTDLDSRPRAEREKYATLRWHWEWEGATLRRLCADAAQ